MDQRRLLVGAEDGVRAFKRADDAWQMMSHGLAGDRVWAVAVRFVPEQRYFAGTYGNGLFQSDDDGRTWTRSDDGISYGHIRTIVTEPGNPNVVYVGTEPAAIFRSDDGGQTWHELETLQKLPGSESWFLPYSPRRGALRSIVVVESDPRTIYGGIEQGGVARSRDRGATWELLGGGVHPDVHQLAISPNDPRRLFAATGGGLFRSDDAGETWQRLLGNYVRSVWIDPRTPNQVWSGPARYVGREGTILRSDDGGDSWREAIDPLDAPLPDMVETFVGPVDGTLLAVFSGGRLLRSSLDRPAWTTILPLTDLHVVSAAIA